MSFLQGETARRADTEDASDEPRVLFVDNFDSFTYNLVEYIGVHAATEVVRNTASIERVRAADPDAIVISPGPGHPKNQRDVGISGEVLLEMSTQIPTLGVCLGLEAAVHAYGGTVDHAPEPVHGKAVSISHDGEGVYRGLDSPFPGGRYHSLVATEIPECFSITARTDDADGLVMGIRHHEYPIECVQFHPESVLTGVGHDVIENFLDSVAE